MEKTIRTLKKIIGKLVREVNEWDLQLPYTIFMYRTVIHETTNPFIHK